MRIKANSDDRVLVMGKIPDQFSPPIESFSHILNRKVDSIGHFFSIGLRYFRFIFIDIFSHVFQAKTNYMTLYDILYYDNLNIMYYC